MTTTRIRHSCYFPAWLLAAAILLLVPVAANAQTYTPASTAAYSDASQQSFVSMNVDREGYVEVSLFVREFTAPGLTVKDIEIPTFGKHDATTQIEDTTMWGIAVGFNPDLHFNVNFDISYGAPKYTGTWGTDVIHGEGKLWVSNLNVEYNLLTGHFSPFVGAGIGLLAFDSGIPNGGNLYYWWDPYWGYTVSGGYTTHHSNHWTWNAAVGVRWDVTESCVIKASYQAIWSKIGISGTEVFPQYTLSVGWRWY